MFTKSFWIASLERAVKTFAQVLSAVLAADGFNLISADWVGTISTVVTAVVLSFLTSIASAKTGPEPSPALFGKEAIPAAQPTGDDAEGITGEPVGSLDPEVG